jgi:hypothetical protein
MHTHGDCGVDNPKAVVLIGGGQEQPPKSGAVCKDCSRLWQKLANPNTPKDEVMK